MKNKLIGILKAICSFIIEPLKEKYVLKSTLALMMLLGVSFIIGFEVVNYHSRGFKAISVIVLLTLLGLIVGFYLIAVVMELLKKIPSTVWFFVGAVLTGMYFVVKSNRSDIGSFIVMGLVGYFIFYMSYQVIALYNIFKNKKFMNLSKGYKYIIHFCGLISIIGIYYVFFTGGLSGKVFENAFESFKTDTVVHESKEIYDVVDGVYGNEDYIKKYDNLMGEESFTTNIGEFISPFGKSKEDFLGFNISNTPLNAHYYIPNGEGPFPVTLIVHGNHEMVDVSEIGYDYLGNYLAARGYIVISVDENFLNYSLYNSQVKKDKISDENDARAYLLLEHIRYLEVAQTSKESVFYGKLDLDSIALMGHSRGGEAVSIAELFNRSDRLPNKYYEGVARDYNIKSIIAIAPTDGQYKPGNRYNDINNVNYLLLHGTHDMDVTYVAGGNQYERIDYTKAGFFKSEILIYGANHGQFNSSWGVGDSGPISDYLHNTGQLISRKQQEDTASQLIYYFLESTLKENEVYQEVFKNIKGFVDLPENLYFTQYHSSQDLIISDFSEDSHLETTTVRGGVITATGFKDWSEGASKLDGKRSQIKGTYLTISESESAKYNISFENKLLDFSTYNSLYITLSDETTESKTSYDFDIELSDHKGEITRVPLSHYGLLQHKLDIVLSKFELFDNASKDESMFQTFELKFNEFDNQNFDWENVNRITLVFPEGTGRKVFVKDIGIR